MEYITLDKQWLMELAAQLAAFNATIRHSMSYSCNFRVSPPSMDEDVFAALRTANIRAIHVGLESGSESIRRKILGRRDYSNEEFQGSRPPGSEARAEGCGCST